MRNTLVMLAAAALLGGSLAAACGDDDEGPSGGATGVVVADVEREPADPAAAATAGEALTETGFDLYRVLRGTDGNLAVSPYSVAAALSMTRVGAAGDTALEMDAVLHAELVDDLPVAFGSLDAELASRPGEFPNPTDGDPLVLELSFANALWPQSGFPFEDAFLETLARHYGAGVNVVDYVEDTEGAREEINGWVAEQTRDRIPELIAEGVLSTMTRLVLTNALYLNAPWQTPFEEEATDDGDFTLLDGTTVAVPLMRQSEQLAHAAGDGWQAVRLPYVGGALSMVVLVPDDGRFEEIESALDAALVDEIEASAADRQVVLALPRWEFRSQLGLNEPLRELGMVAAFGDGADFSAMSSEPLFVSDVVHEVFVSVDEEGTEAAAATAVVMAETSAPIDEPVELTVDRPYLFWIVDEPTGAVLFLGRVLDPLAE